MLLPHGLFIALVDGSGMELYRNHGREDVPDLQPVPVPALEGTNKGAGSRHYDSVGNPAGNQLEEDAQAAAAADWLNAQAISGAIEKLVIIATPRTLGEMRPRYHPKLKQALVRELAKELRGRPARDIIASLRG